MSPQLILNPYTVVTRQFASRMGIQYNLQFPVGSSIDYNASTSFILRFDFVDALLASAI